MTKKSKATFKEGYDVKFNYQKENGFFETGKVETVYVDVKHGANEKNNHHLAKEKIKAKYPNSVIVRVDYI